GKDSVRTLDPLVIPDGRIGIIEFVELSSQRPGKILILGVEAPNEPRFDPVTMRQEKVAFLAVETTEAEAAKLKVPVYKANTIPDDGRRWRRWQEGDRIEPGKVQMMTEMKTFRLLQENTPVVYDQLLGL